MNRFLLLILLVSFSVSSQKLSYSPYSYFGTGDTAFSSTAENQMMGGLLVYYDSTHVNLNNAASLSKLKFVNYSLGVDLKSTSFKNDNTNEKSTATGLKYIAVSVPVVYGVDRKKLFSFSFGLKPDTSVGYLLESNYEDATPPELNRFEGDGGINTAFLSVGFEVLKNWGLGVSTSYAFGSINHYHSKFLKDIELYTKVSNESSLSGINLSLSSVYQTKISEKLLLKSSFSYTRDSELKSKNSQSIATLKQDGGYGGDSEQINLEALGLKETTFLIPRSTSFGLGLGQDKKWFFGLSYKQQNGGGFKNQLMNLDNVEFKSSKQYSIGGFYLPKYDSFTNYFDTVTYRFGVRYQSGGLYVNNEQINDFGINFGLSLPLANLSSANVGVELGQRGTNNSGLVKENYFSIKLGFTLNDLWFIRSLYN